MDKIGTYENCKTSLSCFDDKRYILYDSINSLSKKINLKKIIKSITFMYSRLTYIKAQ